MSDTVMVFLREAAVSGVSLVIRMVNNNNITACGTGATGGAVISRL